MYKKESNSLEIIIVVYWYIVKIANYSTLSDANGILDYHITDCMQL